MRSRRLDAFLVTARVDQFYLSGFTGEDGMALVTPKGVCLISDFRFKTAAERETPWARFVMRKKGLAIEVAKAARRLGLRRIGFAGNRLHVTPFDELRRQLSPVGGRLVEVGDPIGTLRTHKDTGEVTAIRRAIRVAEQAFLAVRRTIRIGQTELELAHRLDYEMGRRGAESPAFPTIVAEGPNAALPHAQPGDRPIRRGSAILFDWGASVGGYRSDLTRVLFVDRIPTRFRRVYNVVLEAQQRAIRFAGAGREIRRVDRAARSHIAQCGYGEQFGHSLGHGLGLEVHEIPSLNRRTKGRLEPGMVVTIEPGIYLPELGGVRIEDDVLVTGQGVEVLTSLPRDLEWALVRP